MSIHILISITTITSIVISVMCFRTVNASGNSVIPVVIKHHRHVETAGFQLIVQNEV